MSNENENENKNKNENEKGNEKGKENETISINLFNKKAPSPLRSPQEEEQEQAKIETINKTKDLLRQYDDIMAGLNDCYKEFEKATKTLVESGTPALFIDLKDLSPFNTDPLTTKLTTTYNPEGHQIAVADTHGPIESAIALVAQFKPDEAELLRFQAARMSKELVSQDANNNNNSKQTLEAPAAIQS